MDYLEKGKKLAQEGNFEEALDAFLLALDNDKENADLHFYLGLSYSSLEQFPFAKYHYEIAFRLNPNHGKKKLVWDGVKDVVPQKPPEKRLMRSAEAKARKSQDHVKEEEEFYQTDSQDYGELSDKKSGLQFTSEKWERAFPADEIIKKKKESNVWKNFMIFVVGTAVVATIVYFLLTIFLLEQ